MKLSPFAEAFLGSLTIWTVVAAATLYAMLHIWPVEDQRSRSDLIEGQEEIMAP